ncbi:hypothetical protein GALMADRAFT_917522 [Galerina marginata CBS 339.88]|uniref:Uncharacterized protein n=1 Tax=Galerina marginata (strain CBS 339.88) TaxID=685588 RepID=A0A067SFE3_GALM3|nr:hypothetical protein GALMADRAFT_917522 [Galerina marginata CBS 339.88]
MQHQCDPSTPGYSSRASPSSPGCAVYQHSTFKALPLHVEHRASGSVLVEGFTIAAFLSPPPGWDLDINCAYTMFTHPITLIASVNSTPTGGGIHEFSLDKFSRDLRSQLPLTWWNIRAAPAFFTRVSRIHIPLSSFLICIH